MQTYCRTINKTPKILAEKERFDLAFPYQIVGVNEFQGNKMRNVWNGKSRKRGGGCHEGEKQRE